MTKEEKAVLILKTVNRGLLYMEMLGGLIDYIVFDSYKFEATTEAFA